MIKQILKLYEGISVNSIFEKIKIDLLPMNGEFYSYTIHSISMLKEDALTKAIVIYQKEE